MSRGDPGFCRSLTSAFVFAGSRNALAVTPPWRDRQSAKSHLSAYQLEAENVDVNLKATDCESLH